MYFAYSNIVWILYIGIMSSIVLRKREHWLDYCFGSIGLSLALAGLFIPTQFILEFSRFLFP